MLRLEQGQLAACKIDLQIGNIEQIGTQQSVADIRTPHEKLNIVERFAEAAEVLHAGDLGISTAANAADPKTKRRKPGPELQRVRLGIRHDVEEGAGIQNEARIRSIELDHGSRPGADHFHRHSAVTLEMTTI